MSREADARWRKFEERYKTRASPLSGRKRRGAGLAELEAELEAEMAKAAGSPPEVPEVAALVEPPSRPPPEEARPTEEPPGGSGGANAAEIVEIVEPMALEPEALEPEAPLVVTLTIEPHLRPYVQRIIAEMEAHPVSVACGTVVTAAEAITYMLLTAAYPMRAVVTTDCPPNDKMSNAQPPPRPLDHTPPSRYNTLNTDHQRREASPPGPVPYAVKTTLEPPSPPAAPRPTAPPEAPAVIPPAVAPPAAPASLASCLQAVAHLHWEQWNPAVPVPSLQHDIHAFYLAHGWIRMRATRWVGIDDPETGSRATPAEMVWYWYPTTATVPDYASAEPDELSAHIPPASRIPVSARPGDANGRPPYRMVTPHGPCDAIPEGWGQ